MDSGIKAINYWNNTLYMYILLMLYILFMFFCALVRECSQSLEAQSQRDASFAYSFPAHDPTRGSAGHGLRQHSAVTPSKLGCHSVLLEHAAFQSNFLVDPEICAHSGVTVSPHQALEEILPFQQMTSLQ